MGCSVPVMDLAKLVPLDEGIYSRLTDCHRMREDSDYIMGSRAWLHVCHFWRRGSPWPNTAEQQDELRKTRSIPWEPNIADGVPFGVPLISGSRRALGSQQEAGTWRLRKTGMLSIWGQVELPRSSSRGEGPRAYAYSPSRDSRLQQRGASRVKNKRKNTASRERKRGGTTVVSSPFSSIPLRTVRWLLYTQDTSLLHRPPETLRLARYARSL